ncbi:MAG: glycosyltransferase [Armatimonadetes bacterium]|nr:glycosyltransferase [Armatimonadota bacterium]
MSPRVTWLLPIKNGMPYLPQTLASIEAQTYPNWEVLAWDNGSTDETVSVLREWIPARLPGRIVTGHPMGLGASLGEMVKQCRTEFCARIDADDINVPERLERQVAFLCAHPDVAVVGSQMDLIDGDGNCRGKADALPLRHADIVHFNLHGNGMAHPTVMFRRSAVLEAGNYRDVGPVNVEDYDLWLRMSARHQLANLDVPLVRYRIHDKSVTQIAIAQNKLLDAMDARFYEQALPVYGCPLDEARMLRERRHPRAIRALQRIARHLEQSQPATAGDVLRSPSFVAAGRSLTGPEDAASRLALARLDPRWDAVPRELLGLGKAGGKAALKRMGLGGAVEALAARKRDWQWRREWRRWLREHGKRGTWVHPTTEFTGSSRPLGFLHLDPGCVIERDCTVWISINQGARPDVTLGHHVFIGRNTYLGAFQPIRIGPLTQIGAYSYLVTANHNYASRAVPIRGQGFVGAPIEIAEDVWIGTHVVIGPGVTIGRGAVIAAGSFVNKDVPPYEVWGGVPARFLKHRPE